MPTVPENPPPMAELLVSLSRDRLVELATRSGELGAGDQYDHWSRLRYKKPPTGLSHEEWWAVLKLARRSRSQTVPLRAKDGTEFSIGLPGEALSLLHLIDKNAAGNVALSEDVTGPGSRDRYILSSLIEEAITSSQLEGASTTRAVAKEMLRSGRPPNTLSERMIGNNFRAMQQVREWRHQPLTPKMVLALQRIVTDGTLKDPSAAGRLQRPDEERVAIWREHEAVHYPPEASELPDRLKAMCAFANAGQPGHKNGFMHPVIRAIILHFWLAYDHPFEDGNGRTARAIFYWSMLRQGYWLAEYLTVSKILHRAPAQYANAFLYTETDQCDLTYFALYHLRVICRAVEELHLHLKARMEIIRATERLVRSNASMNHRQIALLSHAMRHPDDRYTIARHQRSHGVVNQTARTDLLALEAQGLLVSQRIGRTMYFHPTPDLTERLRQEGMTGR